MKTLKYILPILFISIAFLSCTDSNDDEPFVPDPMEGLHKIYEFSATDHVVEIYSEKTGLEVGYNELSIRIKDLASNSYLTNAAPSWMPVMQMQTMSHAAPRSGLDNSKNSSVYNGHIVFQMPGNETEFWELTLTFNLNGQPHTETHRIAVAQPADGLKKVQVFVGNDQTKYILAYVEPKTPKVAVNDTRAVLYKMQDMMTFPVVENFQIAIDPRMPGMNNHSSPNNVDLTYQAASKSYDGKLSLTMTGYWKINMKLLNESDEVVKGEDVTEGNPASSLYFELEF